MTLNEHKNSRFQNKEKIFEYLQGDRIQVQYTHFEQYELASQKIRRTQATSKREKWKKIAKFW